MDTAEETGDLAISKLEENILTEEYESTTTEEEDRVVLVEGSDNATVEEQVLGYLEVQPSQLQAVTEGGTIYLSSEDLDQHLILAQGDEGGEFIVVVGSEEEALAALASAEGELKLEALQETSHQKDDQSASQDEESATIHLVKEDGTVLQNGIEANLLRHQMISDHPDKHDEKTQIVSGVHCDKKQHNVFVDATPSGEHEQENDLQSGVGNIQSEVIEEISEQGQIVSMEMIQLESGELTCVHSSDVIHIDTGGTTIVSTVVTDELGSSECVQMETDSGKKMSSNDSTEDFQLQTQVEYVGTINLTSTDESQTEPTIIESQEGEEVLLLTKNGEGLTEPCVESQVIVTQDKCSNEIRFTSNISETEKQLSQETGIVCKEDVFILNDIKEKNQIQNIISESEVKVLKSNTMKESVSSYAIIEAERNPISATVILVDIDKNTSGDQSVNVVPITGSRKTNQSSFESEKHLPHGLSQLVEAAINVSNQESQKGNEVVGKHTLATEKLFHSKENLDNKVSTSEVNKNSTNVIEDGSETEANGALLSDLGIVLPETSNVKKIVKCEVGKKMLKEKNKTIKPDGKRSEKLEQRSPINQNSAPTSVVHKTVICITPKDKASLKKAEDMARKLSEKGKKDSYDPFTEKISLAQKAVNKRTLYKPEVIKETGSSQSYSSHTPKIQKAFHKIISPGEPTEKPDMPSMKTQISNRLHDSPQGGAQSVTIETTQMRVCKPAIVRLSRADAPKRDSTSSKPGLSSENLLTTKAKTKPVTVTSNRVTKRISVPFTNKDDLQSKDDISVIKSLACETQFTDDSFQIIKNVHKKNTSSEKCNIHSPGLQTQKGKGKRMTGSSPIDNKKVHSINIDLNTTSGDTKAKIQENPSKSSGDNKLKHLVDSTKKEIIDQNINMPAGESVMAKEKTFSVRTPAQGIAIHADSGTTDTEDIRSNVIECDVQPRAIDVHNKQVTITEIVEFDESAIVSASNETATTSETPRITEEFKKDGKSKKISTKVTKTQTTAKETPKVSSDTIKNVEAVSDSKLTSAKVIKTNIIQERKNDFECLDKLSPERSGNTEMVEKVLNTKIQLQGEKKKLTKLSLTDQIPEQIVTPDELISVESSKNLQEFLNLNDQENIESKETKNGVALTHRPTKITTIVQKGKQNIGKDPNCLEEQNTVSSGETKNTNIKKVSSLMNKDKTKDVHENILGISSTLQSPSKKLLETVSLSNDVTFLRNDDVLSTNKRNSLSLKNLEVMDKSCIVPGNDEVANCSVNINKKVSSQTLTEHEDKKIDARQEKISKLLSQKSEKPEMEIDKISEISPNGSAVVHTRNPDITKGIGIATSKQTRRLSKTSRLSLNSQTPVTTRTTRASFSKDHSLTDPAKDTVLAETTTDKEENMKDVAVSIQKNTREIKTSSAMNQETTLILEEEEEDEDEPEILPLHIRLGIDRTYSKASPLTVAPDEEQEQGESLELSFQLDHENNKLTSEIIKGNDCPSTTKNTLNSAKISGPSDVQSNNICQTKEIELGKPNNTQECSLTEKLTEEEPKISTWLSEKEEDPQNSSFLVSEGFLGEDCADRKDEKHKESIVHSKKNKSKFFFSKAQESTEVHKVQTRTSSRRKSDIVPGKQEKEVNSELKEMIVREPVVETDKALIVPHPSADDNFGDYSVVHTTLGVESADTFVKIDESEEPKKKKSKTVEGRLADSTGKKHKRVSFGGKTADQRFDDMLKRTSKPLKSFTSIKTMVSGKRKRGSFGVILATPPSKKISKALGSRYTRPGFLNRRSSLPQQMDVSSDEDIPPNVLRTYSGGKSVPRRNVSLTRKTPNVKKLKTESTNQPELEQQSQMTWSSPVINTGIQASPVKAKCQFHICCQGPSPPEMRSPNTTYTCKECHYRTTRIENIIQHYKECTLMLKQETLRWEKVGDKTPTRFGQDSSKSSSITPSQTSQDVKKRLSRGLEVSRRNLPKRLRTSPKIDSNDGKKDSLRDKSEGELSDAINSDDSEDPPFVDLSWKSTFGFVENDIVWVDWKNDQWPALVRKIYPKQRKASVCFIENQVPEKGIKVHVRKLTTFDDVPRNKLFLSKGGTSSSKVKAVQKAEDYLRKRFLGMKINPMQFFNNPDDVQSYLPAPGDSDEELHDDIPPYELTTGSLTHENEATTETELNSCPSEFASSALSSEELDRVRLQLNLENRKLVDCIKEGHLEDHLINVFQGGAPSDRHEKFHSSVASVRNQLKHSTWFGPLDTEELRDEIIEYCMTLFKEKFDKQDYFDSVAYVFEVWIPEALIQAIMKVYNLDVSEAEVRFSRGSDWLPEDLLIHQKAEELCRDPGPLDPLSSKRQKVIDKLRAIGIQEELLQGAPSSSNYQSSTKITS